MASRGRASRTEAPPPTEAARKIVEKNHNLRPFALESLPKHANSRDVLYRTLRVLRCFILLPCTCPSSRCHGCEPGYKAPLVASSYLGQGMRGKAHPYCRVFEFLVSIVDGLGATTITEEVLFKHLGQQV
jgi:hypothetical protein